MRSICYQSSVSSRIAGNGWRFASLLPQKDRLDPVNVVGSAGGKDGATELNLVKTFRD